MKKISVLSLMAVLTVPAFGGEDVQKLYGTEPTGPVASECVVTTALPGVAVASEKFSESTENAAVQEVKTIKGIKETEEVKTVKEVRKTETTPKNSTKSVDEVQQTKEIKKEIKSETVSNPKARFPHGLQLGVGVSPTSGLNGFIGYNNKKFDSFWAKRFGIRFDFATMSPIKNTLNTRINRYIDDGIEIEDSVKIDNFKLNAKHYGAMIDFYPFGDTWFLGGWRVSGGYFMGKLDLDADIHGTLNGDKIEFELDGKKYTYDGHEMRGKAMADWKYSGPYLGTGFDLGLFWGIKIYMDAGVVFTGNTAKFDLNIPFDGLKDEHGTVIDPDSSDAAIQAAYNEFKNAKDSALADARKEIKDYPYYPLIKLGFMYRF